MSNFFSTTFRDAQLVSRDSQADEEVAFVEGTLGQGAYDILDLGCGLGRHCVRLARHGHRVVGLDINEDYIKVAKAAASEANVSVEWMVSDYRFLERRDRFDAVLSFYSTFGYHSDTENLDVLKRMASALRRGGYLFLEILNRDFPPYGEGYIRQESLGTATIFKKHQLRAIDSRLEMEWIHVSEQQYVETLKFEFRLYSLHEIISMLNSVKLSPVYIGSSISNPKFNIHGKKLFITAVRF
ncbi:class I SAM-dependent methyltransferase [Rhizobium leguminosarum]|uniref:class I SAM-dependent methyltransferase n=1 Tax=Rhizobium leguminosarum TaxID=384 RepID=UPI001C961630|nr:class I SAM-dependent methyltransferase [Rhizobium leguminosarum]MBY5394884.1 class I SAM-dependent methyltransferase [Rhizobium leguminosarum]